MVDKENAKNALKNSIANYHHKNVYTRREKTATMQACNKWNQSNLMATTAECKTLTKSNGQTVFEW